MTSQLAAAPLPDSVHGLPVKLPEPLLIKLTVPVGVIAAPASMSLTAAVQLVAWPASTRCGEHVMDIALWRR